MPTDSTISSARDLTLQKIGRNVVNFQRMEAMLKFIRKYANFSAPLYKIKEELETREKRDKRSPMGRLVDDVAKDLHSGVTTVSPDTDEAWLTYSLSLGEGKSQMHDWRKGLQQVVRERNALIHDMLAAWNPNSIESCQSLCEKLDAQREMMLPISAHLESVMRAISEAPEELARALESQPTSSNAEQARST